MTRIPKHRVLPHEEEVGLHHLMLTADAKSERAEARERLITHNLRLAMKICQEYRGCGMEIEDLFSEAVIGLMSAVDRWDPPKGSKLSSYATVWIKQKIKRALSNQSRTVRLPVKKVYDLKKINETKASLALELGRPATKQEISKSSGVAMSVIETIDKSITTRLVSLDSIDIQRGNEKGSNVGAETFSDKASLGEAVEDRGIQSPLLATIDSDAKQVLDNLLQDLPTRERVIISERFGLTTSATKTLDEVGKQFGITKERVRQIQAEVLKKLRKELEKKHVDDLSHIT
jgi:RNA polymerase sigma factor (sigma-70 family)